MILKISELLNSFLYIKIFNIPFIIIWVIATGIFCTAQFKFINFRLLKYGIQTLFNLKCNNSNNGIITHIQAFATVISGTVGLGTISGVAIAITIGGPSAVFWMVITGILGMSIKFAEVVLAFTYRSENTTGGAFYYMEYGLAKIGFAKTGRFLAFTYAIMLLIAMILGGIPFQANQIAALSNNLLEYNASIIISLLVFIVILGGIKRIAFVSTSLAPIMIVLYVGMCIYLIYVNGSNLLNALSIIFQDIFNKSAIGSGVLSGLIAGVRRSVFANEAGTGTAAIAHSAVKEEDPIKVGCVAMIAPLIDTILISFLTGIVIIITGMHSTDNVGDITLISSVFSTALPLFSKLVFPLMMFSFAFSTIIAYCYYCEVALLYLFGSKKILIPFQILIVVSVYISCMSKNIEFISYLGDSLFMCLMIPNAVAIYLLRREVLNTIDSYTILKGINMIYRLLCMVLFCLLFNDVYAASGFYESYDAVLNGINNFMNEVLFFKILYVPFIILLLVFGYVFLTLRFGFLNIRMFKHAFAILCGKYDTNHHDGHITHFQAFMTALSSTVGLGTVAGVAIAVSMGGPGAVPWMMITGFFGMSAKFAEVTLAFRHRTEDQDQLFSGPFQYIRNGLEEFGFKKLGIVLAAMYAVFFVLSGLGGSVAFQTNQMVSILSGYSSWVDGHSWFLSSIISALLALVIIGGIKRIARVSSALVPIMSLIYIFSCIIIIAFNIHNLGYTLKILFSTMIDFNAVGGGMVGAFVAGIQRAIFASEAGVGSASITHATTKDEEPVRTGLVAMIEPCFDTMLICCLTGITIVITGAYQTSVGEGILITQKAFETVSLWFPILLTIAAPLFAFSSVISFVYCCEMGWLYLFGAKSIVIYRIAVIIVAFFSGLSKDTMAIANIGGTLFSCLALINMTALILFSNQINDEVQCYLKRLKNNKIN